MERRMIKLMMQLLRLMAAHYLIFCQSCIISKRQLEEGISITQWKY